MAEGLRWLDSMSVGRAEFDRDHLEVIETLATIRAALERGEVDVAHDLAEGLLALAADHVEREEAFLRLVRFPTVDVVIAAQRKSLSNIADLVAGIVKDPVKATDLVAPMEIAFVDYLIRADINFKSYVDAAGLKDVPS